MKSIFRFFQVNIIIALLLTASCSLIINSSGKIYRKALASKPYDAIIVPGVPFEGNNWSDVMKIRVYWSYYLWKEGIAKNIIYSGSAVYTPYRECEIMAAYAEKLGVHHENIILEPQAEHSTENLYYGYKKAKKLGYERIGIATDPFQNSMLKSFRKAHFKDVQALPIQFDILDSMNMVNPIIEYDNMKVPDFVSITEREGFFKRLRGTLGRNVIDSIRN